MAPHGHRNQTGSLAPKALREAPAASASSPLTALGALREAPPASTSPPPPSATLVPQGSPTFHLLPATLCAGLLAVPAVTANRDFYCII